MRESVIYQEMREEAWQEVWQEAWQAQQDEARSFYASLNGS